MKQIMVVHYVVVVFLLNTEYKIDGDGGTLKTSDRLTEKEEESEMNRKRSGRKMLRKNLPLPISICSIIILYITNDDTY